MGNISDRVRKIIDNEGLSISQFERIIGSSKGTISKAILNGTDLQARWLSAIISQFPHYNALWILTGEGNMSSKDTKSINEPLFRYTSPQEHKEVEPSIKDPESEDHDILKLYREVIREKTTLLEFTQKQLECKDLQIAQKDEQINSLMNIISMMNK